MTADGSRQPHDDEDAREEIALRPQSEMVHAVARLGRGPIIVLAILGGFLLFSSLYIAWFGTRWGLLIAPVALAMLLAVHRVSGRVRRGRAAVRRGRPLLAVDAEGVTGPEGERTGWEQIDRLVLTLHRDVPLDELPEGTRATVANSGGNRGTWRLQRRDGSVEEGRLDFVPSPALQTFLVKGADHARAHGSLLLHSREE